MLKEWIPAVEGELLFFPVLCLIVGELLLSLCLIVGVLFTPIECPILKELAVVTSMG